MSLGWRGPVADRDVGAGAAVLGGATAVTAGDDVAVGVPVPGPGVTMTGAGVAVTGAAVPDDVPFGAATPGAGAGRAGAGEVRACRLIASRRPLISSRRAVRPASVDASASTRRDSAVVWRSFSVCISRCRCSR